jgi:NAD+ synthase (glutamine-hydrolysing)
MEQSLSLSPAALGFVRVAVISPELRVADVDFNTQAIGSALATAAQHGCRLAVFPELCITGYSCADLLYQELLLEHARAALVSLAQVVDSQEMAAVVGLPLQVAGKLYNCAALLARGRVMGIVPKTYLPSTSEFYEERWFTPSGLNQAERVEIRGQSIPFGVDLLFDMSSAVPALVMGIEICEDLWAVEPPSGQMALAGATLLVNPSASPEVLTKAEYRRDVVRQQSARCLAAYCYAGAGPGESTTDLVWAGHSLIVENGSVLAESERFSLATQISMADVDVQRLVHERLLNNTYSASRARRPFRSIPLDLPGDQRGISKLIRPHLHRMPFVPTDSARRAEHSREIFDIQSTALARRLQHTGSRSVTIGVSGGLDSTLALLVAVRAFEILGLSRTGIVAISMPGFGTTDRTRGNAVRLAEALGVSLRIIPIVDAVRQHFRDIGHDENIHDVTYENAQARERTQILMDVANQVGAFNVGTGDLSELALGWCTYNADHMSMYHVNAGVPKTLVRYLIEWAAEAEFSGEISTVLRDICATPITPELLPLDEEGELEQKTEDTIGPYELHDFFLFHTLRFQSPPSKVFVLAQQAFEGQYTGEAILRWLEVFYRRFFSQQYKRSAMPDGPKVGSVALSPRGDWRMPSDASSALWMQELAMLREFGTKESH